MSGSSKNIAAIILGGLVCLLMVGTAYAAQQQSPKKHLVKQAQRAPAPTPQPAADPPPAPPPTLEQMPASAPQVSFHNGQLSIVAPNSTLGDILRAVRAQTGASVEVPGNAPERVVVKLGPGPARDVLASLLNGSHFNYVLLGSVTDPAQVEKIILTSKAGSGAVGGSDATNEAGSPPGQGILQQAAEAPEEMQGDDPAEEATDADNQADQANQPDEPQANQPNGQPAIKTPEQLLQELQRQQQIQQQQPQQQPGQPQTFPIPRTQPPQLQ